MDSNRRNTNRCGVLGVLFVVRDVAGVFGVFHFFVHRVDER
jgi:hypothetical protein